MTKTLCESMEFSYYINSMSYVSPLELCGSCAMFLLLKKVGNVLIGLGRRLEVHCAGHLQLITYCRVQQVHPGSRKSI